MERPRAPLASDSQRHFVLIGGSGSLGTQLSLVLRQADHRVTLVDRSPPPEHVLDQGVAWLPCDFLVDDPCFPAGELVLLLGTGNPRPRWPWTLPLDIVFTTARLRRALLGRATTLISSIDVYGTAASPLVEERQPCLPWSVSRLDEWWREACLIAREPCPAWRVAAHCRLLAEADATGRWVYGMSKLAQERLVRESVLSADCTVLRLADTVGVGQARFISQLVRRALLHQPMLVTSGAQRSFVAIDDLARVLISAPGPGTFNVGGPPQCLSRIASAIVHQCASSSPVRQVPRLASDSAGVVDTTRLHRAGVRLTDFDHALADCVERIRSSTQPLFEPPIQVVVPPRPVRPDALADRQQAALWQGQLKSGNRWSREAEECLRLELNLDPEDLLILTPSGTQALRLAVVAVAGAAQHGEMAIVPSITYPATANVLVQLGYTLRYVDVDEHTWTMDVASLEHALADGVPRLVVCVDTFGNPCEYRELTDLCSAAGIPLVADSAAGLGARYLGQPLATQADAHAFSMSFAKVISAGGAGGAVVIRAGQEHHSLARWLDSARMDELHAAAALDQLPLLEELVARRQAIAGIYHRAIEPFEDVGDQAVRPLNRNSYVHWVMRVPHRSRVMRHLMQLGIQTREYFRALHLEEGRPNPEHLPVSEALDQSLLALPMSSELTPETAGEIALGVQMVLTAAVS